MFISYKSIDYDDRDVKAELIFYRFTKDCISDYSYLNISEDYLNSCAGVFPNSSLEVRVGDKDVIINKPIYERYKDYCGFKGSVFCKSLSLPIYSGGKLTRLDLFVVITAS